MPWRILRQITADYARRVKPAPHRPDPGRWRSDALTASWLGHSTVLMNFYGVNVLTDPVFSARAGLNFGFFTLGPKRYVAPALKIGQLPRIDMVLLSHAHMDHFDLRSLRQLDGEAVVVTAKSTADLLKGMTFRKIIELDWNESAEIDTAGGTGKGTSVRGETLGCADEARRSPQLQWIRARARGKERLRDG